MPVGIDGWLIWNVALGVFVGELLRRLLPARWRNGWTDTAPPSALTPTSAQTSTPVAEQTGWGSKINWREVGDFEENEDWEFLWDNVPDTAKEGVRLALEDTELLRRARAADLWPQLWYSAPEMVRTQLRHRWKEILKIPPRWKTWAEFEQEKNGPSSS